MSTQRGDEEADDIFAPLRITCFISLSESDHSDDEVDEEVERGVDRDEGVRDPVQDLHPPGPLHVAEAAARRRHDLNMSDERS